jgi:hypothetical protein
MQETSFDGFQNSNKIEEYTHRLAHRLTFLLVLSIMSVLTWSLSHSVPSPDLTLAR